jgi:large-conductance mechanosensitive channel
VTAAVDCGVVIDIAVHVAIGVAYGTMTAALDGGVMRIIITCANKARAKRVARRKKGGKKKRKKRRNQA